MTGAYNAPATQLSVRDNNKYKMSRYYKKLQWVYRIVSFVLFGYGIKTIITQEISANGSRMRGAAWALNGTDAIILGSAIAAAGVYLFLVTVTTKE